MNSEYDFANARDFGIVFLVFLGVLAVVWLIFFKVSEAQWEKERANPPPLTYTHKRVEVVELSRCVTERAGVEGLAQLKLAGVKTLEVVRRKPVYQECHPLSGRKVECGWTYNVAYRASDDQHKPLVEFNHAHPALDLEFGLKMSVNDQGLRVHLPISMLEPSKDMDQVCRQYHEKMVGGVLNALKWANVRPAG